MVKLRFFVDNYIQIKNINVFNELALDDISILTISDIHISKTFNLEKLKYLINLTNNIKPDYIIVLGDTVDSPIYLNDYQDIILNFFTMLCSITKTIVILGNHDVTFKKKKEHIYYYNTKFFNKLNSIDNLIFLNNKIYVDNNLLFMGYTETFSYYYPTNNIDDLKVFYSDLIKHKNLYKISNNYINIALIHSQEFCKSRDNLSLLKNYDLILSGHNHDGCIPFGIGNFNWGLVSPSKKLFPKYARGLRNDGNMTLIINGGITKIQEMAPKIIHPLNHLCPMQIDLITISSRKKEQLITKKTIYMKKI